MQKFIAWMEQHFVPIAAKIGSQRHLVAIRDGFIALMPLVMAGSLAVLLNNVLFTPTSLVAEMFNLDPASGYLAFTGKYLVPVMGNIWWGTFAVFSLVLVFTIAYTLAKSYEVNPLSAAVVAVAGYLSLTPQGVSVDLAGQTFLSNGAEVVLDAGQSVGTWGNLGWQYLNFGALLTAILVTLVITQIFVFLMKRNITIKLPDNVPPAVGRAFAAIIPGVIAITLAAIVPLVFSILVENAVIAQTNIFDLMTKYVTDPFLGLAQNPFSAIIYVLAIQVLWFFGLHGGNMMGAVTNAIYLPAVADNANAISTGAEPTKVFTSAFFDSFVHIGGAGATLAIVIVILFASKRKDWREITKIGGGASVFQINEPIMFGLPVVLSPILIIPFLVVPVVLTTTAYFATVTGMVDYTSVIVPWVTPVGISGFLSTSGDWRAFVLAFANLAIAAVIYYPFVLLANKYDTSNEE